MRRSAPVTLSLLLCILWGFHATPAFLMAQSNPEYKTGRIHANGLNFAFLESGSGPLVLAFHGFPDLPRTFRHQMRALADAGYRVVAPYMRGYAPTDVPPEGSYAGAVLVQDVLALIDAFGEKPVILMGHDWGASAVYGAAIMAPEKVSKLIAIAVPRGPTANNSFIENPAQQRRSWYIFFFQMPWAEEAVAYDNFAFIERLWQDWSPGWQFPAAEMDSVKATFRKPGVLTAALNYYRHTFGDFQPDSALAIINSRRWSEPVPAPTLYLHGAKDGGFGVELTEGMEEVFANGLEKRIIADAGHFVHQEKYEEVNRLILAFLTEKRNLKK
ncbi:MAG: alpha/beta hydrolase [Calditrichia bacterium]|nr:alpha/beta hydrolase [Calditrichia bacterium]